MARVARVSGRPRTVGGGGEAESERGRRSEWGLCDQKACLFSWCLNSSGNTLGLSGVLTLQTLPKLTSTVPACALSPLTSTEILPTLDYILYTEESGEVYYIDTHTVHFLLSARSFPLSPSWYSHMCNGITTLLHWGKRGPKWKKRG